MKPPLLLAALSAALILSGLFPAQPALADEISATSAASAAPAKPAPNANSAGKPPEIETIMQMPEGEERKKALSSLAPLLKEWAQREPLAALLWLQQVKTPTVGPWSTVLVTCGQTHGKVSADWSLQTNGHPFIHPLLFVWASNDPATAAQWCLQAQKPDEIRYLIFFSIGDGAAMKDPAFATAWTEKLELEADRLAAIRGIMLRWPASNFQAATAWIKQQKGEALKVAAMSLLEYHSNKFKTKDGTKDVPGMKAWLDQFPLSDAEKEAALNGPGFSVYTGPKKK